MSIKIEKRGKYPGVKVHLEPDECEAFINLAKDAEKVELIKSPVKSYLTVAIKIGKKMLSVAAEQPDFLIERTPEQVKESLLKDQAKIEEQLKAMGMGKDWKKVQ